ncbi:hypothetical protein FSARC_1952 [Fusarium sarcochroum]|uniref:Uncharacterized protein n=1 Tax=Fusarium sarcochroum TaxID=1208366 RepID=A0A8H4XEF7_9HYPO|nr:hypothetical protein FSARC_1952 [Fusarium sarcochroum]
MACSTGLNFTYPVSCGRIDRQGNELCTIQPDPDIAGIGVLVAFITIGITTILLFFAQICLHGITLKVLVNPTTLMDDDHLLDCQGAQKPGASFGDARSFIEARTEPQTPSPLSATIALLSDTQFFMGIAIASAMSKQDIVLAHFCLAYEMASLGFITSTVGLLMARAELLDKGNVPKRFVRLIFMWILLGLLIHRAREFDDDLYYAEKVHKSGPLAPHLRWDFSDPTSGAGVFFLSWTIGSAVVDSIYVWPALAIFADYYIAKAIRESWLLAKSKRNNDFFLVTSIVLRILYCFVYVGVLIPYLMFWEPFFCNMAGLGFFIWSIISAFEVRQKGHNCMSPDDRGTEDELGFGQIVALVMLLAPAIGTADLWWDAIQNFFHQRRLHEPSLDSVPLLDYPMHSQVGDVDLLAEDDPLREGMFRRTTWTSP